MLFRPCGAVLHDDDCKEPVINFSEDTRCVYHTVLPPLVPLNQQVKDLWYLFDTLSLNEIYLQELLNTSPLITVDDETENRLTEPLTESLESV